MTVKQSVQHRILDSIKENLPDHLSLVDELADLLNISKDSAYRRLRGEKSLDIREIQILSNHFNLSLDSILNTNNNVLSFNTLIIDSNDFTFQDWLNNILELLGMVSQMNGVLSYFARDLPIFHHFLFPELSAFKIFFWYKTYLNDDEVDNAILDFDALPAKVSETIPVAIQIRDAYVNTASEEIWTRETINILLNQILYYYETGIFKSASQAKLILDQFAQVMEVIQNEARLGQKLIDPLDKAIKGASFNLYYNEVSMGDNSIVFSMGDKRMAFLTASVKMLMNSSNPVFCEQMELYHSNFKRKSTLISRTSEKERLKLFSDIKSSINHFKSKIY